MTIGQFPRRVGKGVAVAISPPSRHLPEVLARTSSAEREGGGCLVVHWAPSIRSSNSARAFPTNPKAKTTIPQKVLIFHRKKRQLSDFPRFLPIFRTFLGDYHIVLVLVCLDLLVIGWDLLGFTSAKSGTIWNNPSEKSGKRLEQSKQKSE